MNHIRKLLVASIIVTALAFPALGVLAGGPTTVASLDPSIGELPEGIAVDASGTIYAGMAPTGAIVAIGTDGSVTPFVSLPSPGTGFLTGLEFGPDGYLYAGLASFDENHGIWRVSPDGSDAQLFASLPSPSLPNGLDFDSGGNLYVSNTMGAQIWKIDPAGNVDVWIEHILLAGIYPVVSPFGFALGVNGIAFNADESYLYTVNTEFGWVARIAVEADGSAGAATLVVEDPLLGSADGVAFGADGTLYVATLFQDAVVAVTPDGSVSALAAGGLLHGPASLAFGPDGNTLYVTNFDVGRAQGLVPGDPQPGILAISLGAVTAPDTGNAGLVASRSDSHPFALASLALLAIGFLVGARTLTAGRRP